MTNLLILAAGQGSRCKMFTFDGTLPKCLLSAGDKTVLESIIDAYKGIVDNVYIACQTVHAEHIRSLLSFRKCENFHVVAYELQETAMQSVSKAFSLIPDYEQADWFINWSDVIPPKMSIKNVAAMIYADNNYVHRNLAYMSDTAATKVVDTGNQRGNVPGIFYCKGITVQNVLATADAAIVDYKDFDKSLAACEQHTHIMYLDDVVDTGDYIKYTKFMLSKQSDNVCRYFNKLEVEKDKVIKSPATEKGVQLHNVELAYYRKYASQTKSFAKLLSYDTANQAMHLERIKGSTCQTFIDSKPTESKLNAVNKLIAKFKEAAADIYALPIADKDLPTEEQKQAALIEELSTMMEKRVRPVASMIQSVCEQHDIVSIEHMPITKSFDKLKQMVDAWLSDAIANNKFTWSIVHGDPNTANCMLDKKGNVRFVDPRGYFGNIPLLGYGIQEYDLAKFAYGFSGYVRFNNAPFIAIGIDDGNVETFIGPKELENITDVSIFDMNVPDDIKVLVGIIWVKLAAYIINDPMKSVLAYLYGNAILTKLLAK